MAAEASAANAHGVAGGGAGNSRRLRNERSGDRCEQDGAGGQPHPPVAPEQAGADRHRGNSDGNGKIQEQLLPSLANLDDGSFAEPRG